MTSALKKRFAAIATATALLTAGCSPYQPKPEPRVLHQGQQVCIDQYVALAQDLQRRNPTLFDVFDQRPIETAGDAYRLARNLVHAENGLQGLFVNLSLEDREAVMDIIRGLQFSRDQSAVLRCTPPGS